MKALATKVLVLLFATLVVHCAFDGPGAQVSTPSQAQDDSAFCGSLNAASVEITLQIPCGPRPSPGETIGPLPMVFPLSSLAQSIDHPPERPA